MARPELVQKRRKRGRGPVVVFRVRHDARRGDDRILPAGVVVLVAGYQHDLEDYTQAKAVITRIIHNYNHARLHSALSFLRPVDYYREDLEALLRAIRLP